VRCPFSTFVLRRGTIDERGTPAGATCVIAADGVRRGGKVIDLWGIAKDALASVRSRRPVSILSFTEPAACRRRLG
jgi:acyl-coenzyme A synthetase/AMP-(fatty) acid ligase